MISGSAGRVDYQFQMGDEVKAVRLEHDGAMLRVTIADRVYEVKVLHSRADEITFTVEGVTHTAFSAIEGSTRYVAVGGEVFELKQPALRRARRKQHQGEDNPKHGQLSCDHPSILPCATAGRCGASNEIHAHPMLRASPLSRIARACHPAPEPRQPSAVSCSAPDEPLVRIVTLS